MNSLKTIPILHQIRAKLLNYRADDTPSIIDDTSNNDVQNFLDDLSCNEGNGNGLVLSDGVGLIRGVAGLRESLVKEIRVLEKVALLTCLSNEVN